MADIPGTKAKDVSTRPASPSRRAFLGVRPGHAGTPPADAELPRKAAIGDACLARRGIECRICGEACSEAAIRFRPTLGGVAQPYVLVDACTGCGACVAPCPTGAIPMMRQ